MASITLYDAQTTALTVTQVIGAATYTGSSNPPLVVGTGATSQFLVSTPGPNVTANTQFSVTISAMDQYDNATTGYGSGSGTCLLFSGPSNSPGGTAPIYPGKSSHCSTGQSSVNFTNGVGTAAVTLFDAQTTNLTVAQATSPSISGVSGTFVVNSAASKTLSVANPGTQTAGAAFNVTLTATDTYGNPSAGTQAIAFSNPANSPAPASAAPSYPSSVTFTGGSGTRT